MSVQNDARQRRQHAGRQCGQVEAGEHPVAARERRTEMYGRGERVENRDAEEDHRTQGALFDLGRDRAGAP